MTDAEDVKDLVVLVADKSMECAVAGVLDRPQSLGIRGLIHKELVHPYHDPGCCTDAHNFLKSCASSYAHALVMFDHEGCGRESASVKQLEQEVEGRLSESGWGDRARAVVIAPELEAWFWSDSPHVDEVVGWRDTTVNLRTWLVQQGFLADREVKPERPKETLDKALRQTNKRHSSSLFAEIAGKVGLERCQDPSFHRFRDILREWFPPDPPS